MRGLWNEHGWLVMGLAAVALAVAAAAYAVNTPGQ